VALLDLDLIDGSILTVATPVIKETTGFSEVGPPRMIGGKMAPFGGFVRRARASE